MIPTIKAEFKKLLSIRSTYGWCLAALILVGFVSFYIEGFKDSVNLLAGPDKGSLFIAGTTTQISNTISVFSGIIALLLIAHEYRYNTIIYTLTASNSRTKVIFSKMIAVLGFVLAYALIFTAIGIGLIFAGAAVAHHVLPHQDINYLTYFAKSLFLCEGYALAALLFGTLIRNQVGAIAALFILPGTVESLLSLLLKNNSVYLPFTALSQVTQPPVIAGAKAAHPARDAAIGSLSPARGALVFLAYLIVGWAVGWYLFLRRDAN